MPEYEVEVEITLKVTLEDVEAPNEEEAGIKAAKEVREDYERKVRIESLTQIDNVDAVWVDKYEN